MGALERELRQTGGGEPTHGQNSSFSLPLEHAAKLVIEVKSGILSDHHPLGMQ